MGGSVIRHLHMTRIDLLWAGIRLLGVWTAILALQAAFKLPGAVFAYLAYLQIISFDGEMSVDALGLSSQMFAVAGTSLSATVSQFVGLSVVAWYLLRRGDRLIRLLEFRRRDSDAG
jgi:hypothetical protein